MGLPSASSEFVRDFWQSPPAFVKHTVTDFAMDFRLIFVVEFWSVGFHLGSFWDHFRSFGGHVGYILAS